MKSIIILILLKRLAVTVTMHEKKDSSEFLFKNMTPVPHLVLGRGWGADCCGAARERGGVSGCTELLRGLRRDWTQLTIRSRFVGR